MIEGSAPGGFGTAQWFRLRGYSVPATGPWLIAGPLVIGRVVLWGVGIGLGLGPQRLAEHLGLAFGRVIGIMISGGFRHFPDIS